jgi:hypothetical protein
MRLALEGEGLRGFAVPSGSARPVPFGSPRAAVLDFLQAIYGSPPREQGENLDCGAEFAGWKDGLTVWFAEDRFVGWSLQDRDGTLTTASGVGIGSVRSELEAAHVIEVVDSSLGVEFTSGGLAGLLDSARPDARVTNLWAGLTCIAR